MRDDQRGIIAIMAALLGTVLIGGSALAIDISYWRFRQEQLQVAADAVSASAIYDIESGVVSQAALQINSQAEAVRDGCGSCTVNVTYPYNGSNTEVQVLLTDPHVRRFFSSMYGSGDKTLAGLSVAGEGSGGTTTTKNSPFDSACILALNTSGIGIQAANGSGPGKPDGVINPNCEVISNSTSSDAISLGNNAEIAGEATTPGGISRSNKNSFVGKANVGAAAVADPYASIVSMPSSSAGPCSDPQSGGQSQPLSINGSSGPSSQGPTPFTNTGGNNWSVSGGGHWCKGMNLSGITLDMGPGLYIIDGNFNLSNTTINATSSGGTTLVLGASGGNFNMNMNTNADTININAPPQNASSGIPGIAMMNYTDDPGGRTIYINNNTTINFTGTIYFPRDNLNLQNSAVMSAISGSNGCGHVVVGSLAMTNGVAAGNNCSASSGVQPMGSSYSSTKWGTTTTTTTGSGTSKPIFLQ